MIRRAPPLTTISVFIVVLIAAILCARIFDLTVTSGAYYVRLSEQNRLRRTTLFASRGKILDRSGLILAESTVTNEEGGSVRVYRVGEAFGHVLGYLAQPTDQEVGRDTCSQQKLIPQSWLGKVGIESVYECQLRGVHGFSLREVSATEKFQKIVETVPALSGADISLAIDSGLQQVAYAQLAGRRGSVIVMKPQTGEVLALVSSPSFNPQDFIDKNQMVSSYLQSKDLPLFNRALEGVFPPGSVFKMVLAAAGLEEQKITPSTIIEDTGFIEAGGVRFGNWYYLEYGKTEGNVDLVKSLQRSNDIYYYRLGEKLGPTLIAKWAQKFGYGGITHIDLPEKSGTLPSPFWKEEVLKEKWFLGDTYNTSIGQGYLQATPAQVTQMTQILANGGRRCRPKLLKVLGHETSLRDQQAECEDLNISRETLDEIEKGMVAACATGGTGWPFFDFSINKKNEGEAIPATALSQKKQISVACKTGTAEISTGAGDPHAWFTAYAPVRNPEILITVLVEEGGQGSDIAAPIAKEVLSEYFSR